VGRWENLLRAMAARDEAGEPLEGACRKIRCTKSVLGPLVLEALVQISTPGPPNPPITHRANFDKSRPDRARSLARRSIATPSHLQSGTDGPILKCAVPDNRSQIRHA
jgi:hypothetical protein